MFGFTGLTLSKDRVMFYQPDFIQRRVVTTVGKFMHCLRDGFVRLQAELSNKNGIVLQNNVSAERDDLSGESISQRKKEDYPALEAG